LIHGTDTQKVDVLNSLIMKITAKENVIHVIFFGHDFHYEIDIFFL